ncbi:MAG: hypothetical protein Q8M26_08630 [Pseudolabrys sp.]|nr:hypothetical protein [Pseudolabrys sp.]
MTRRNHPLPHTTAGEAIGAGIAMIVGILVLAFFGFVAASFAPAWADDTERAQLRGWYRSLMQPDNPGISCCGEADGYFADKIDVVDGKVYATITDTRDDAPLGRRHIPPGARYLVPPHKITWKHGNPTGHTVIFIGIGDEVLCFVQNGGV